MDYLCTVIAGVFSVISTLTLAKLDAPSTDDFVFGVGLARRCAGNSHGQ
jgi:hypothetical protein